MYGDLSDKNLNQSSSSVSDMHSGAVMGHENLYLLDDSGNIPESSDSESVSSRQIFQLTSIEAQPSGTQSTENPSLPQTTTWRRDAVTRPDRSRTDLKSKYKNLKAASRKRLADEKLEIFLTGGGSKKISATEADALLVANGAVVRPLLNSWDSDAPYEAVTSDKLLSGVNDTRILRDIRGDVEEPENRCQLVTRKDLQNVKSSMGIGTTSISHVVPDELSVKVFVEQMADNILCYKEQNTGHYVLDKTDFMLAFMMPLQRKMLAEFGSDRICIDSTHGQLAMASNFQL
ncbi:hypothetical protein JTE90_024759 [Oedothorax gibbosus]|uniref:Uncharacterized protein n=1 Tax=Oedothorax gibbosus TaxID=931172 RepID=A0AAV6UAI0_9ARAC|nr:hypothetical protein JTE90_024759 [Oedothorax gibbosus]